LEKANSRARELLHLLGGTDLQKEKIGSKKDTPQGHRLRPYLPPRMHTPVAVLEAEEDILSPMQV